MSENKESEYNRNMDDFEIITPANGNDSSESTSLEQNESNNMDENNEAEMSAEDVSKDPESEDANPSNQELQWMEEKTNFLASIEELNKSMTERDEQLKALNSKHEQVVNHLESQRVALEKVYEELQKKEKELEESNERTAQSQDRIQELENTIDDLQKKINEKNVSFNASVHMRRETQWIKEKDEILGYMEKLEKRLKEKEEQLQDQEALEKKYKELETEKEVLEAENTRVVEEIDDLKKKSRETDSKYQQDLDEVVSQRAVLQIACEEFKAVNDKLMAEKSRLQDESHQTTAQSQAYIQKLQGELIGLQKHLEETTTLYESKLSEKQEALDLVQEQLACITQQTDNANRKIAELEAKNMEIQQGRAALEQELAKRKNLYTELSGINNEMEEQISKNKRTIRELKAALQEKTKKNEQQSEEILELKKANDNIKTQMGKFVNTTREVQSEKDRLEGELVNIKLEEKRLSEENTSHSRLVQELRNETIKLAEERDFCARKCKRLEEGVKLNADNEISQLTKALEALNDENDVLRKRNIELGRNLGALRSNKNKHEKANENHITVGKENGGYSSETSHEGETQQKSVNLELMDTSTDEPAAATPPGSDGKQWYDTDRGGQLFADIHRELNGKFVTIDISRAVTNKDISLVLTTDQNKKFTVNFPKHFPNAAVLVTCGRMAKQVKVPFNTSSEFVTEFTKKLCEIAFSEH